VRRCPHGRDTCLPVHALWHPSQVNRGKLTSPRCLDNDSDCRHPRRPAQGWVRRLVDRMLEDGRLAGGDAMRRVQTVMTSLKEVFCTRNRSCRVLPAL